MIVWRGMGIALPILLLISGGVLSLFFDDTRIGNPSYLGWTLLLTALLSVLPALAAFGDDENGWTHHTLFFVPIALWVVGFLVGGVYALV